MRNGAEVNIDDFVDYTTEYKAHVKKSRIVNGHLTGLCPFHNDTNNSFSVDLQTGKWHCFSEDISGNFLGFYAKIHDTDTAEAYKEILAQYGREQEEERPQGRSYSLAQYAFEKKLPEEWLKEYCKAATGKDRDGTTFLKIPYYNEDGSEGATRKRYARKQFKWKWGSSGKIGLYGEWRLPQIRKGDAVILVEGESDSQSLWYMELPAVGSPGASMFKAEYAEKLQDLKVYIHQEKDSGGETFVKKVLEGMRSIEFIGEAFIFSCGDIEKCKDPSDVLMRFGKEEGKKHIMELVKNAKPIDLDEPEVIPEAIKGAPVNLRIPEGWKYSEKGISRFDEKSYEPKLVCRTPIILTRRLKSLDTGDEKIEVAFLRDGEWHTESFPRSVIFTSRGITALSDLGCTVTSENAKQVVRFLSALEAENIDIISRTDSTSTFGWQRGNRFIPGMGSDIFIDIDPSQKGMASAYCQTGSMEGWIATMRPQREKYKFRFILAAAFAAPLLRIVRQRTFFLHNWGGSRTGKTAALKAALSAWGDSDRLTMNFNATQVGLERMASFFSDLPMGIDERQLAGNNQAKLENIVYMISSGMGKLRGAKTGGIQTTHSWRTIAMSTGEEPLSTNTSQTGVNTRVLEIYCGPFESEAEAAQMYQDIASDYGHAGPEFVRHLVGIDEDSVREWYARMQDFVKSVGSGKAGSHVASVAVIALADAMIEEWFFKEKPAPADGHQVTLSEQAASRKLAISPDSWGKACEAAKKIMEEQMSAAAGDVNESAVQFVTDWVLSNQAYFGSDAIGTCLGTMSEDGKVAYIYTSALNSALKREGYNERKTKKYMADKGFITAVQRKDHGGETYTVTSRFQGRVQRFVEFFIEKAQGLSSTEESKDEWLHVGDDADLPFD